MNRRAQSIPEEEPAEKEVTPLSESPYQYDAFVSYRHQDPDQTFAYDLVRQLEADGYKVALDGRDFVGGRPLLDEFERCVKASRFTLAVISPLYFESGNTQKEARLRVTLDMSERTYSLVPLLIEKTQLPTWMYELVPIDYVAPNPLTTPYDKLKMSIGNPL